PKLAYETRSGVKSPSVLMERNKKHIRVIIEDFLGSIPVMHIGIHDCNPADSIFPSQVFYKNSLVIYIAEPPVSVCYCHCMMTGRADKPKSLLNFRSPQGIPEHMAAPCCDKMGNCRLGFYIRHTGVDSGNVPVLSKAGFIFGYFRQIHQAFFKDLVPGIEEAFFSFRMGRRNSPVKCREENQTCLFGSGT